MQKINVIAFGGLGGNVYSAGLKTILLRLDAVKGVDFRTYEDYSGWRKWGSTLPSWRDPTVLLGHSFGVAAMFGVVNALGTKGPAIPLAISFDPSQWWWSNVALWGTGGNVAAARIGKVINFYQHGFPIGGQTIARTDGSETGIENRNVDPVAHAAVEDRRDLQDRTVNEIRALIDRLNPPANKTA